MFGEGFLEEHFYLYLDTAALSKLYVAEEHSDLVRSAVAEAWKVCTSRLAYVEARAAFARLRADGDLEDDRTLRTVVSWLDADWESYETHPLSAEIVGRAGDLAEKHERLRANDAVHLATALEILKGFGTLAEDEEPFVRFLTFDRRLLKAARREMPLYFDPFPEDADEG